MIGAQLKEAVKDLARTITTLSDISDALWGKDERIAELTKMVEELDDERFKLRTEVRELGDKLKDAEMVGVLQANVHEREAREAKGRQEALAFSLDEAERGIAVLRLQSDAAQKEIKSLNNDLRECENEIQEEAKKRAKANRELREAEETNSLLLDQIESVRTRLRAQKLPQGLRVLPKGTIPPRLVPGMWLVGTSSQGEILLMGKDVSSWWVVEGPTCSSWIVEGPISRRLSVVELSHRPLARPFAVEAPDPLPEESGQRLA